MKRKFVLIDTKTFEHSYYEDNKKVISETFDRVMDKGHVAKFLARPFDFIKALEQGKDPV